MRLWGNEYPNQSAANRTRRAMYKSCQIARALLEWDSINSFWLRQASDSVDDFVDFRSRRLACRVARMQFPASRRFIASPIGREHGTRAGCLIGRSLDSPRSGRKRWRRVQRHTLKLPAASWLHEAGEIRKVRRSIWRPCLGRAPCCPSRTARSGQDTCRARNRLHGGGNSGIRCKYQEPRP